MKKPWQFMIFVMFVTFAGYAFYLRTIITSMGQDSIFSATLLFWAIFTVIVLRTGYQLFEELKTSQTNIVMTKRVLESDQSSINKLRNDLESKNDELEKILAELYALRNLLEDGGKSISELKRMNRILGELKLEVDAYKATRVNDRKQNPGASIQVQATA